MSRRPRQARIFLLATMLGCVAGLAVTSSAPQGEVLDVVSDAGLAPALVNGQEPQPAQGTTAPAAPAEGSGAAPRVSPASGGDGAGTSRADASGRRLSGAPSVAPPVGVLEGYAWPIARPRLTLPFGPTAWGSWLVDGGRFHDGIDLATFCGDRIMAAHAGTVIAAGRHFDQLLGWIGDLGPYFSRLDRKHLWTSLPIVVVVDDGNGYRSVYAHFERIKVKAGQQVAAGQVLGYEGATGHATGCHLHYSLFSPWERTTFALRPDIAGRMKLPGAEIARVDPLLVFPARRGISTPPATGELPTSP